MNGDSNHHRQTTALKYPNVAFCSISIQGAQGFVVNENNIAMIGAFTEASRISIPTEPYDFSLEKSIIQKFDERKGEEETTESANTLEDNEASVSASSGSPVNGTESNRNDTQSPNLLELKYAELSLDNRSKWDSMKSITECSDEMCFDLLQEHEFNLDAAIEHFFTLP